VQLLPFLDVSVIRAQPKLFIGYSDTTTLLSWLTCGCGVTALHGPMLEGRLAKGISGYDERSFVALLQDGRGLELSPVGVTVLREGEATGPLFGGTLTQLVASFGTPYAFDPPKGAILFLEDVNERPYRVDRMLTQLRLSGVLERASALVFGEMLGCDEPGGTPTALETLGSFLGKSGGPVLAGFPSGHSKGPSWTLPLGVTVRVVTRPQPAVIVEEAPVE
jgi:muramoyltetrapeptide carboxypeptidase